MGVSRRLVVAEGLTSEEVGVLGVDFAFVDVDFVVLFFLSEAFTTLRGAAGAFVVVDDFDEVEVDFTASLGVDLVGAAETFTLGSGGS